MGIAALSSYVIWVVGAERIIEEVGAKDAYWFIIEWNYVNLIKRSGPDLVYLVELWNAMKIKIKTIFPRIASDKVIDN